MQYRKITLEDKEAATAAVAASGSMACHTSFVNLYMWRDVFPAEIAFQNGFLFRRSHHDNMTRYHFPLGPGDPKEALDEIFKQAEKPLFVGLTKAQAGILVEQYPHMHYKITESRDNADYIYETEKLITLAGRKLHGKRNHINRFQKDFEGRWETEEINGENLDEIRAFHKEWCEKNDCAKKSLRNEACAVRHVLNHMEALGLRGLLLRVDGNVAAYSLVSAINPQVADVHVEKADIEIDGAYAIINQQTAEKLLSGFAYTNREEDMGLPGLRKAKESYRPAILLMLHRATPGGKP